MCIVCGVMFLCLPVHNSISLTYRNKDIKQELVKEWLDDDFEWPPQNKRSYTGKKKNKKKHLNHSPNYCCAQLNSVISEKNLLHKTLGINLN